MSATTAAPPTSVDDSGSGQKPHTWRDVAMLAIVVAAVVAITFFVVRHFASNATNAATILGIVIPSLATIGAAIFGVKAAYDAGTAKGQADGTVTASDAAQTAQQQTAQRFTEGIHTVKSLLAGFHGDLLTQGSSPRGTRNLRFATAEMLAGPAGNVGEQAEIDTTPLEQAQEELNVLQGIAEAFGEPT